MSISVKSNVPHSAFYQLTAYDSEGNQLPDFLESFVQHSITLSIGAEGHESSTGAEEHIYGPHPVSGDSFLSSTNPTFRDEYRFFQELSVNDRSAFFSIRFGSGTTREDFVKMVNELSAIYKSIPSISVSQ